MEPKLKELLTQLFRLRVISEDLYSTVDELVSEVSSFSEGFKETDLKPGTKQFMLEILQSVTNEAEGNIRQYKLFVKSLNATIKTISTGG